MCFVCFVWVVWLLPAHFLPRLGYPTLNVSSSVSAEEGLLRDHSPVGKTLPVWWAEFLQQPLLPRLSECSGAAHVHLYLQSLDPNRLKTATVPRAMVLMPFPRGGR